MIDQLTALINKILKLNRVPEEYETNILIYCSRKEIRKNEKS